MNGASLETDIEGDQCTSAGCRRRWTCDFGHGRPCSQHDKERFEGHGQRPIPMPVPKHPPVRPFNEVAERDEGFDDEERLPF